MTFLKDLLKSFVFLIILAVIFSFAYPLSIYVISQLFFHSKANGSLIIKEKRILGSELLGQKFSSPHYFHGRPSIVDYSGLTSDSSNFGPTSKELLNSVKDKSEKYRSINNLDNETLIPMDAITYSGSGLDPHITYSNALLQAQRVAKNRNISVEQLLALIKNNANNKFIFSRDKVNVLKLNLELDEKYPLKKQK